MPLGVTLRPLAEAGPTGHACVTWCVRRGGKGSHAVGVPEKHDSSLGKEPAQGPHAPRILCSPPQRQAARLCPGRFAACRVWQRVAETLRRAVILSGSPASLASPLTPFALSIGGESTRQAGSKPGVRLPSFVVRRVTMPSFRTPAAITRIRVHRKRGTLLGLGLGIEHYVFLVLYALALEQCYSTVGHPYAAAVAHAKARQAVLETATAAALSVVTGNTTGGGASDSGAGLDNTTAALLSGQPTLEVDPPAAVPDDTPDDFDPWAETGAASNGSSATWAAESVTFGSVKGKAPGVVSVSESAVSGYDPDDPTTPLPHPLLPAFWAMVLTASVALLHVLSQLAQHWSIRAKVLLRYRAESRIQAGSTLLVDPPEHQGKAVLADVQAFSRGAGSGDGLFFLFQRQRYELERDGDTDTWNVVSLPYPVDLPLAHYLKATGLRGSDVLDGPGTLRSRFGRNEFNVALPTLWGLYVEQLLGPVTQFQLFSALLWIMDEYWKYALFHAGMIFMFEGTTAFSRLRSLQTLRGMGHRARMVFALRGGVWTAVSSDELLPGDVVSLSAQGGGDDEAIVPADCLILEGSAVTNEASLTGESVPQMKEAARADALGAADAPLDMGSNTHRVSILSSGTILMKHVGAGTASAEEAAEKALLGTSDVATVRRPPPPDNGVVCYVLRTGFASSQGALMRMIEFSQEQVTGDSRETLVLLLILLVFALVSAGHVLRTGLAEGKKSQYELLLRCVFILTTVVPPELPMQTALAVNTSLMALHKAGVFCTEPYRIPIAGKLDSCLFDKTGTLTTDKLVAQGIVCWPTSGGSSGGDGPSAAKGAAMQPMSGAQLECSLVLAGCHSLLEVDGKLVGDPIEVAGLRSIKWVYTPANSTASPKALGPGEPGRPWKSGAKPPAVRILHRYHFSSALQRMSVLAHITAAPGVAEGTYALVKGSAEAVGRLLVTKPAGYDVTYKPLAARGMRILALAWKKMPSAQLHGEDTPREAVECDLTFLGFVAFSCRTRQDSAAVVKRLLAGGCEVSMVTGDDPLTALHVAREVGICRPDAHANPPLLLAETQDGSGGLEWVTARVDLAEPARSAFTGSAQMVALSKGADLCVTGESLRAAVGADPSLWAHMEHIRVFARMKPQEKEAVLKELRAHGRYTLMCGDGANDVGALKQAHVGLALLSGFGDANTKKATTAELAALAEAATKAGDLDAARKAQQLVAEKAAAKEAQERGQREAQERWKAEAEADRAELLELQKVYMAEELERHKEESWATVKALKAASQRLLAETKRRNEERLKRFGGNHPFAPAGAQVASMMEGLEEGDLPRVKLGDASIAAPFTSKVPSICSVVDIIRQGRCALVNTAQQQQILALNCLISAYSLSALYLDGIKSGEAQMIATGILLTIAGMAFSFARPVDELSPVPPLRSVFHPAYALSLIGQLLIHLACMVFSFRLAKQFEPAGPGSCVACGPPPGDLTEGTGFFAEVARQIEKELAKQDTGGSSSSSGYKFKPSLLNTVVFLVTTAQQVSVMFVNYKGRPFMQGITENPAFMWSVALTGGGAFVCAFERAPELNRALKLVSMPNDDFRWRVLQLLAISTAGAFLWDRLCLLVFAPKVFRAALAASRPDPVAIFKSSKRMMLVMVTFLLVVGSNMNLLVLFAVYQAYKRGLYN